MQAMGWGNSAKEATEAKLIHLSCADNVKKTKCTGNIYLKKEKKKKRFGDSELDTLVTRLLTQIKFSLVA